MNNQHKRAEQQNADPGEDVALDLRQAKRSPPRVTSRDAILIPVPACSDRKLRQSIVKLDKANAAQTRHMDQDWWMKRDERLFGPITPKQLKPLFPQLKPDPALRDDERGKRSVCETTRGRVPQMSADGTTERSRDRGTGRALNRVGLVMAILMAASSLCHAQATQSPSLTGSDSSTPVDNLSVVDQRQPSIPFAPAPQTLLADFEEILGDEAVKRVSDLQKVALDIHGTPIVVVSISKMSDFGYSGTSIESFARNWFQKWEIGKTHPPARPGTGILLLVSVGDRKARIEFGNAWQHRRDAYARQLMDRDIVPNFKKGDYSKGILVGVESLAKVAQEGPLAIQASTIASPRPNNFRRSGFRSNGSRNTSFGRRSHFSAFHVFFPVIFVVIAIISAVARGAGLSGSGSNSFTVGNRHSGFHSSGFGSGGSSFGGGGSSFGGGSSGGGGASGSW